MARPQRNSVDYFPFFCEEGEKMFYLEETYGNDGFAVFVKLLRELAKTDFHYLDLSKKSTKMFLSARCKVSLNVLESIINDLSELGKFDSELWTENGIVWCEDFIDSIQDAYSKRSNNCIDRNGLIDLLISKGIRKPSKVTRKPSKQPSKDPVNPQSKVEYSKVEKSKEDIFNTWIEYRKEIKKEIKVPSTYESLIKKFNYESLNKCIWVVNNSIENNYQGLFWDNYKGDNLKHEQPEKDTSLIYYHWQHDKTKRSIEKSKAEEWFEGHKGGGYIAIIPELWN